MKFRQLGIALMVGGFLAGQLLASIATRAGMQAMMAAAGGHDPELLNASAVRSLTFTIWGNAIALVGLVIYFYGVLTSSSGGRTTVVAG